MKANELRLLNFVNYRGVDIILYSNYELYKALVNIKDIEPIPLTEEWLLKFGFDRHNNLFFSNHDYFSYIELDAYGCDGLYGYCLSDERSIYHKLEHVHQLQNLYFALTGEELTLKDNEQND